ncbi:hypothetical protein MMC18_000575 [Xylographa bjoerkii]|nr:hypothetical protein [Xylographa bjoerkii]
MAGSKDYGRRLVPVIVDELARNDPERAVYSIPLSQDVSNGFKDISACAFANAVNRTSWWLHSELGKGSSFQSVGYIGPHDLRYVLLILACIKTGYKALLISPRNSIEGSLAVLEATNCNIWVLPEQQPQFMSQLLSQRTMKLLAIPEADELLRAEPAPDYPYNKTFEEASNDPFCVLHTSGTTGHPKPITWKNSLLGTLDATSLLPKSSGRPPWVAIYSGGDQGYSAFPFFHGAGLIMNIFITAFYGTCCVLGPSGVTPTLDLIDSLLDHGKINVWSIIPSIVDEVGESSSVRAKFKSSKIIIASGGPVTYASANKITEVVRVLNITGTLEGLFMGSLLVEREDWIYFSFHPYAGFDYREIEPGVYEQWVIRNDKHVPLFQGIFHTFPDEQEMSLKDLYTRHPTKPDLWLYQGRTDDIVVLSNGEKIRPLAMEAIINSHPAISACLVVGTRHFQAALLVELIDPEPTSTVEREALMDSIYERVQAANDFAPAQARVLKECIMFSSLHKPFARTDKNTVKRRATVTLYENEIEEFYKELDDEDGTRFSTNIDTTSLETTAQGVRDVLIASLPSVEAVGLDDDLFHAGLDSLLAFRVAKCLRSALDKYDVDGEKKYALTPKFIFANPTTNKLSTAFYSLLHKTTNSSDNPVEMQIQYMKELRARYTDGLPQRDKSTQGGNTIILTGSTGSLGSYLLESLVRQKNVNTVYCLNRVWDGIKKQAEFLQADLSKPSFGLSHERYSELLRQTTHIIHNQWPVNFNYEITSFEPHIQGVRHLVDFSLTSDRAASIFFISTIGTVSHLASSSVVPEAPNSVLTTALGGYGSSKQVCELMLQDALEISGLDAVVCRVGQIAGPVLSAEEGMWAKQEWIPTIIASSKYLGVLPSTLGSMGRVDWIPVDILADIIVELAGVGEPVNGVSKAYSNGSHSDDTLPTSSLPVYHAVNPKATHWAKLVPTVSKYIGPSVKVVSWGEWVEALRNSKHDATAANLKQNPALKLLDFFESMERAAKMGKQMPVLETKVSARRSRTMASLEPVSEEWMEIWLKQWVF